MVVTRQSTGSIKSHANSKEKQGPEPNKVPNESVEPDETADDFDFGDADSIDSIYHLKASLHVMSKLNDMREEGTFCDLILELNNSKFLMHQNVIALWSPVLRKILRCHEGFKQHVHIYYSKPDVFKNLLSFLYTGEFADEIVDIPEIMSLATTFEIRLLQELCVEHMMSFVTPDNVISLYHNAVKFQLPDLRQSCLDIMQQQLPEVSQSEEFRNLSPEELNFLFGSGLICGLDPELKLCLIISWLSRDVAGRKDLLVHFLGYIDWSVAAAGILEEISQTENIFTSYPEALYLLLESIHASSISLGSYEDKFEKMKEQYCYLPKKVVSGEVVPGAYKADIYIPVGFALVSYWNGNQRPSMPRQTNRKGCYVKMDKSSKQNDSARRLMIQNPSKQKQATSVALLSLSSLLNSRKPVLAPTSKGSRLRPIAPKPQLFMGSSAVTISEGSRKRKQESPQKTMTTRQKFNKGATRGGKKAKRAVVISESEDEDSYSNSSFARESSEVVGNIDQARSDEDTTTSSREETSALNLLSEIAEKVSEEAADEMPSTFPSTEGLQKCPKCEFTSDHKLLMEEHYKKVHLGKCRIACDLCPFSSKWDKEFYNHMKLKHFPGPRFCCDNKDCAYSTEKIQALLSHRTEHGNLRPFTCDICLKAFRRMDTLTLHIATHPGKLLKCSVPNCDFSTSRGTLMKYHMQSHEKGLSFPCKYCKKTFVQRQGLTQHLREHKSSPESSKTRKYFACKACEYSTMDANRLRCHYERHHSKEANKLKAKAEEWKTRREFGDTVRGEQWKKGSARPATKPTSTSLVRGRDYKKELALPSIEDDGLQVMVVKSDRLKDLVEMQW